MDRSYLSDPAVIAASRNFICVRLVTYEDVEEMEFMKSIYDFRTPTKNSLFAILDSAAEEHLVEPERLVNLKAVPGLDQLEVDGESARLGALVTLARIERDARLRALHPVLAEAAETVGSPQIRTRATLGGNLCQRPRCWYYRNEHAVCLKKGGSECFAYGGLSKYNAILGGGPSYIVHPSDMAPALIAVNAQLQLRGPAGAREMPLGKFFVLPADGDVTRENVLAPDEIVTGVVVPSGMSGWISTYVKFREKGGFDFALSAVALALRMEGKEIADARLVLGGVPLSRGATSRPRSSSSAAASTRKRRASPPPRPCAAPSRSNTTGTRSP